MGVQTLSTQPIGKRKQLLGDGSGKETLERSVMEPKHKDEEEVPQSDTTSISLVGVVKSLKEMK